MSSFFTYFVLSCLDSIPVYDIAMNHSVPSVRGRNYWLVRHSWQTMWHVAFTSQLYPSYLHYYNYHFQVFATNSLTLNTSLFFSSSFEFIISIYCINNMTSNVKKWRNRGLSKMWASLLRVCIIFIHIIIYDIIHDS